MELNTSVYLPLDRLKFLLRLSTRMYFYARLIYNLVIFFSTTYIVGKKREPFSRRMTIKTKENDTLLFVCIVVNKCRRITHR